MLPSNSWALASWVSRFHSACMPSHSVFFLGLFSWPSRVTSGYYLLEASSGFLVPGLFSAEGVAMRSWGRATENHRNIHAGYLNQILLLPSIWISLVNFFLFFFGFSYPWVRWVELHFDDVTWTANDPGKCLYSFSLHVRTQHTFSWSINIKCVPSKFQPVFIRKQGNDTGNLG